MPVTGMPPSVSGMITSPPVPVYLVIVIVSPFVIVSYWAEATPNITNHSAKLNLNLRPAVRLRDRFDFQPSLVANCTSF